MRRALTAGLCLLASGVCIAAAPELVGHITNEKSFLQGVERFYPTTLQKDAVNEAQAEGGMWLSTPDGEHLFVRTVRVDKQRDGNQTWIGKVSTKIGEQSVVITFGKDAVFGSLVSSTGKPLKIVTRHGATYFSQLDDQAAAAHPELLSRPLASDMNLPLPVSAKDRAAAAGRDAAVASSMNAASTSGNGGAAQATSATSAASTASSGPVVDVLVGYTPGLVTSYGSASAAVTRINYLVSITNQAYVDSQVNGRIRLAGTMEVNYTDSNTNSQALSDLSSYAQTSPLATMQGRRRALGADLVSLVRQYSYAAQGNCGLGTVNGADETPFTTAMSGGGYSLVGDGSDSVSNTYCTDYTFAHELGHNMGLVHDQPDAPFTGAFPYAYGWRESLTTGSFYTIMAYSTGNQQLVPYFADPAINSCNGNACGDPTVADQTQVLNQTMPYVAAFNEPGEPAIDMNGDSAGDLLFQNNAGGQFAYISMDGVDPVSNGMPSLPAGYQIAAVGDLAGNGLSDLILTSSANSLYYLINNGDGTFSGVPGPSYPAGWRLVGTGDINGDGQADLIWEDDTTHQFAYWLMSGTTRIGFKIESVAAGYYVAAIGDFTGSGMADVVWTSAANDLYFWLNNGDGTFTSVQSVSYPAGWQLVGAGDINGDQRADLVWENDTTHQYGYWLMNGATRLGYKTGTIAAGYRIANVGRYAGGTASILWTSPANDLYLWQNNGSGSFTSSKLTWAFPATATGANSYYSNYLSGWSVVSSAPPKP